MDIILIPGFWLDASSWDDVVPALERAGHRAHALTPPGMESRDAGRSSVTLRDHIDSVVGIIDSIDPARGQVVLVGHSGGGAVAHGAVDARPDRVARVVYVDSGPLGDGGFISDEFPAENGEIPLPDWSLFPEEDLVDHPAMRELARIRDVGYIDLPTGHWPQFTRPAELGEAILAGVGAGPQAN